MGSPVFRRQVCTEHLPSLMDKGKKLKHMQSLAQTPCLDRAGMEKPRAGQREVKSPHARSPVGCHRAQPLLPHRKTQFSSIPPFTQSLFVHPPKIALPQTDTALSQERPADFLSCWQG